jgi:hypothetical protein
MEKAFAALSSALVSDSDDDEPAVVHDIGVPSAASASSSGTRVALMQQGFDAIGVPSAASASSRPSGAAASGRAAAMQLGFDSLGDATLGRMTKACIAKPVTPAVKALHASTKAWTKMNVLCRGDNLDLAKLGAPDLVDDETNWHKNTWDPTGMIRESWCQVGKDFSSIKSSN